MLNYKVLLSNAYQICCRTVKSKVPNQSLNFNGTEGSLERNELEDSSRHPDLLMFDLSCIVAVTENFSPTNKLGQGGFGSVFKVQLDIVDILHIFYSFIYLYCKGVNKRKWVS